MKKTSLLAVVLLGLCAVIWSAKAVYEIVNTPHPTTGFLLTLDIVCAICWIAAFLVQLWKCIKSNKEG